MMWSGHGDCRASGSFLHTDWAVVTGGDDVQTMHRSSARLHGPRYELAQRITVKGAPAIEIYSA